MAKVIRMLMLPAELTSLQHVKNMSGNSNDSGVSACDTVFFSSGYH